MSKQFWCKCGTGPGTKEEISRHVYDSSLVEKGKHGRLKRKPVDANPPATEAVILPSDKMSQNVPPQKPEVPKIQKTKSNAGPYLGLSIIFALAAIAMFGAYFVTLNMFFGYTFIIPAGLAWFFFYRFRKSKDMTQEVIAHGGNIPKKQVNCMNLYPRNGTEKRGVLFEDNTNPQGQPWICDNDNKPYFVNIWKDNKLVEFDLPDEQYYDPKVYAERVLSLPAHRQLFKRKQNLLQKLSPFILLLVIFAEWLIIITTTSPAKGA